MKCTILGDGTIQHFGITFDEYKPATFNLRCTTTEPSLQRGEIGETVK